MKLYLNGQEIEELVLAEVGDPDSLSVVKTSPAGYLKAIDDFLQIRDKELAGVKAIYVVLGPGSATALRTVVTIANTTSFITQAALFGLIKNREQTDRELLEEVSQGSAKVVAEGNELDPEYQTGPKITQSNKDALLRQIN